jgi:hypothetical protein
VCAIACGLEGALAVFCIGAIFLSLEAFEVQYLLFLIAAQLAVLAARPDGWSGPLPDTGQPCPVPGSG